MSLELLLIMAVNHSCGSVVEVSVNCCGELEMKCIAEVFLVFLKSAENVVNLV